jgi:hypothetical protein
VNPKLLKELNSTWNPSEYSASSTPPRKDFVPFNKRDQAGYGKQNNADFPQSAPVPPNPASLPFPLENVVEDFADSYIYLMAGLKKIAICCKSNKALKNKQKKELMDLYTYGKKALNAISKIGMKIQDSATISSQPTPDATVPTAKKAIKRN